MCGFAGFTGNYKDAETIIGKMMNRIVHRGPDSSGTHISPQITLGFQRLSLIDLQDGSQPMYNEDGSIVIVFNGEIYNYQPLRDMLIKAGHIFKTRSDTEVLLHLYEEYGADMLPKLRGMFSFVIHEIDKKKTFAARDFFGIKPFYYFLHDNNIIFGSEIKSFLEFPFFFKELNEDALEHYLTFQYSVLSETFFKGVFKLLPGHYFIFENGNLEITRYFSPKFTHTDKELAEAVDETDRVILDSIEAHKVSDVEVGAFLSGGVDSSYVASCFNGVQTFTVGFDYEKYNEIRFAKPFSEAIGIENISKTISAEEFWQSIPRVQYHMDEPLADPSAIALYFVSQLASGHVKAVLSGEGADEFFGGYNIYKEPLGLRFVTWLPMCVRRLLGRLAGFIPFSFKGKNFFMRCGKTLEERYIGNANIFSFEERRKILKNPVCGTQPHEITKPYFDAACLYDDITKMQYLDIHLWLVGDILLKADKMSMAHSLEVRVPFLDKHILETASALPLFCRVNKRDTKYAFRLAAKRHMPRITAGRKKLGFPVPIRLWLREDRFYNIVKQAFTEESGGGLKYFKREEVLKLLNDHKRKKRDNSRKIWAVYMFLIWYNQFFKQCS